MAKGTRTKAADTGIAGVTLEQDNQSVGDLLAVQEGPGGDAPSLFTENTLSSGEPFDPYKDSQELLKKMNQQNLEKQQEEFENQTATAFENQAGKPIEAADKVVDTGSSAQIHRDEKTISEFFESAVNGIEKDPTKRIVTLKPKPVAGARLGLANQKEKYHSMPGAMTRWAVDKVGGRYVHGFPSTMKVAELNWLESELGVILIDRKTGQANPEFYRKLSVQLDRNRAIGEQLNLGVPRDRVIFYAMSASSIVAASFKDLEKKPFAEWYIEDIEAEAEEESKERDERFKATELVRNASPIERMHLAKAAGLEVANLGAKAILVRLERFLEEEKKQLLNARTLLKLNKQGNAFLRVTALVKDAIRVGVIVRTRAQDYVYGNTVFGSTEEQIVNKLMDPLRADIREAIQTRVETAGVTL